MALALATLATALGCSSAGSSLPPGDSSSGSTSGSPGAFAGDASSGGENLSGDDATAPPGGDDAGPQAGDDASAPPPPAFTDQELTAQGCDLGAAITAYTAGATSSASSVVPAALVPCFSPTGFGGQESSIGLAKDGSVFVAPAYGPNGNGLVRSNDFGKTWTQIVPGGHGRVQPFLYLDPATDRLLFATSTLNAPDAGASTGFDLSWSADEGATWTSQLIAPDVRDWIKFYAGPPVTSATSGYPTVIYASAPSPISTPDTVIYPPPAYQAVYKSLNGGASWSEVSMGALTLVAADAATSGIASSAVCPSSEWVIYGNGLVGKDGTVYIGLRLCTTLGIAISTDEGASWKVITVPGSTLPAFTGLLSPVTTNNLLASEPLAMDPAGNLYAIWNDANNALRLSTSPDKGQTWSGGTSPIVVSAPGVTSTIEGAVAVRAPGNIAIAYYGTTDGKAYNGYMAESLNALDAHPVFSSAIVNKASDPLFSNGFDNNYLLTIGFGDLDEMVQVKYAPNGDVWATFVKEMCASTLSSNCSWDYAAHANSVFQGATGRLVHRAPSPATGGDASSTPQ
ncbi:MAG TPA: sialidase family protein [Polyangiaceae bacterium]|nr:sialidase family protein [Polyangiaceae bacterium]